MTKLTIEELEALLLVAYEQGFSDANNKFGSFKDFWNSVILTKPKDTVEPKCKMCKDTKLITAVYFGNTDTMDCPNCVAKKLTEEIRKNFA